MRRSSRLCRSLWLDRCCHPLSFLSLKEPKKNPWPSKSFTVTVLNLLLLSLQYNYFTLLPRPLEPSSHSLCEDIYISILVAFTMCCCTLWKCHWILWSVHMVQARIERKSFASVPVSTEPLRGWRIEESKGCIFLKKKNTYVVDVVHKILFITELRVPEHSFLSEKRRSVSYWLIDV